MPAIELKSLIGRLNDVCRRALEGAAGLTALRTHYNVEIEHMLVSLLDRTDTDVAAILRHWNVDPARLSADLNRSLDRMKTGNARAPSLSPDIVEMVKAAWLLASVEQGANRVRSGHLLWALLADEMLSRHAREASGHWPVAPTFSSATTSRCAATPPKQRKPPATRSAPKRPAPAPAKYGPAARRRSINSRLT